MTPAEIGHRVVKAAAAQAERWGFVRCIVPAADLSFEPRTWIHADANVDPAPYVAAADRIVAGVHDVFALENVDLLAQEGKRRAETVFHRYLPRMWMMSDFRS